MTILILEEEVFKEEELASTLQSTVDSLRAKVVVPVT